MATRMASSMACLWAPVRPFCKSPACPCLRSTCAWRRPPAAHVPVIASAPLHADGRGYGASGDLAAGPAAGGAADVVARLEAAEARLREQAARILVLEIALKRNQQTERPAPASAASDVRDAQLLPASGGPAPAVPAGVPLHKRLAALHVVDRTCLPASSGLLEEAVPEPVSADALLQASEPSDLRAFIGASSPPPLLSTYVVAVTGRTGTLLMGLGGLSNFPPTARQAFPGQRLSAPNIPFASFADGSCHCARRWHRRAIRRDKSLASSCEHHWHHGQQRPCYVKSGYVPAGPQTIFRGF